MRRDPISFKGHPSSASRICLVCSKYFSNGGEYTRHLDNLNIQIKGFCYECENLFWPGNYCFHPTATKVIYCDICNIKLHGLNINYHVCFHGITRKKVLAIDAFTQSKMKEKEAKKKSKKTYRKGEIESDSCRTAKEEDIFADTITSYRERSKSTSSDSSSINLQSTERCAVCFEAFSCRRSFVKHWGTLTVKTIGYCFACNKFSNSENQCSHTVQAKLLYCCFCKAQVSEDPISNHICFHKQFDDLQLQSETTNTEEGYESVFQGKIVDAIRRVEEKEENEGKTRISNTPTDINLNAPAKKVSSKKILQILKARRKRRKKSRWGNLDDRTESWLMDKHKVVTELEKMGFCLNKLNNDNPNTEDLRGNIPVRDIDELHQEENEDNLNERTALCLYCLKEISISRLMRHENEQCSEKKDDILVEVNASELQKLTIFNDNEETNICVYCLEEVPLIELVEHESNHTKILNKQKKPKSEKGYSKTEETVCTFCGETLLQKNLKSHEYKKHHSTVCEVCGQSFTLSRIRHHMLVHTEDRKYSCHICGKTFKLKKVFRTHRLVHTENRKHKCTTCGKAFKVPYNLRVHMRSHLEVKPYGCEICGKTFTTKQWRNNHKKCHFD